MIEPIETVVERIAQCRAITPTDISALRQLVWNKPELVDADMRALIEINRSLAEPSPAFADMYAEAMVHFLLRQEEPKFFLKERMVEWIETRLVHEGRLGSYAELETLVRILEQAENAPDRFKRWALSEIERSVLSGQGPTRLGGNISPGVVDADDAKFLRRALFARGSLGALAVTAEEAEMLFRIKDITKDAMNAREWNILFVQATANFLQAHVGRAMLTEEEMTRLDHVLDENRPHIARFLGRVGKSDGGDSINELATLLGFGGEADSHHDDEVRAAHAITGHERDWLRSQIAADGRTDRYEKALLTFLADEHGGLPQALEQLRIAS